MTDKPDTRGAREEERPDAELREQGEGELPEEELLAAKRAAEKFDLRKIIAALFLVYGVTLTLWGVLILLGVSEGGQVQRPVPVDLNLWTGIGMLIVGGAIALWALLAPIRLVDDEEAAQLEQTRQER